jgi:hypothetical protein
MGVQNSSSHQGHGILCHYPQMTSTIHNTKGIKMVWNFFATWHGKGEVDGPRTLF